MRYRPFGRSGLALSTLGLRLSRLKIGGNTGLLNKLIVAGLESGINTYHLDSTAPDFLRAAAEAFSVVERRLLFISVDAQEAGQACDSIGYALHGVRDRLRVAIKESGLHTLDLVMFSPPGALSLPDDTASFLDSLKQAQMVRYVGARGATADLPGLINCGRFNVIETSFDIDSSWDKRRQIDRAVQSEINVIASDFFPAAYRKAADVVPKAARRGWFGGKPESPLAGAGTHAFLHQTPDWTAEELCLGYALAQPTLSCIFIDADTPSEIEALAAVTERTLPSSVPAQIEMARFNDQITATP
jgi:aryl-alcohol dehydrogenase-like predicted oxidoreductase